VSELVGRQAELRLGEQALDSVSRGHAGLLFVVGQPGIGKTRLVDELLRGAERRKYLVLNGRGGELEQELPFGIFADALDAYVAAVGPELEPSTISLNGPSLARRSPNPVRSPLSR
jgi:predicted ATPase